MAKIQRLSSSSHKDQWMHLSGGAFSKQAMLQSTGLRDLPSQPMGALQSDSSQPHLQLNATAGMGVRAWLSSKLKGKLCRFRHVTSHFGCMFLIWEMRNEDWIYRSHPEFKFLKTTAQESLKGVDGSPHTDLLGYLTVSVSSSAGPRVSAKTWKNCRMYILSVLAQLLQFSYRYHPRHWLWSKRLEIQNQNVTANQDNFLRDCQTNI